METAGINPNWQIDWTAPWFAPYAQIGQRLCAHLQTGGSVAVALNSEAERVQCPVCFVPQEALPKGTAYESFIFASRSVPTRDNLHDLLNGLIWLHFPKSKMRLNALQDAAIKASGGVQAQRGTLRDALTLFDENAALLWGETAQQTHTHLRNRAWHTVLVDERSAWGKSRHIVLFGHALLEKLITPYKSITAHVWALPAQIPQTLLTPLSHSLDLEVMDFDILDTVLCAQLNADLVSCKPFAPLPVLGVPSWCADNTESKYYQDAGVFRPPKNLII